MTQPKIRKFLTKTWTFWKNKFKILDGHEQKIKKMLITASAKLNFLSPNEMLMKLKNYYKKQRIWIFAPYNFLIFLYTQLHEPKISQKTVPEFFGNVVSVFLAEISIIQRNSLQKR